MCYTPRCAGTTAVNMSVGEAHEEEAQNVGVANRKRKHRDFS